MCDGTLGTPNLRDRFVVGAGDSYSLGATGGANTVILTVAQMPAHTHQWDSGCNGGPGSAGEGRTCGNYRSTLSTGGSLPHENRPLYYALYYICKV